MHCIIQPVLWVLSALSVLIVEPSDGETYQGDWLPLRVIVENENQLPDSVCYSINGAQTVRIPRLNTDWPTYMQNQTRNGRSDSPGPSDPSILWSAPVTTGEHVFHSPAVVDGVVYYCSAYDSLFALDVASGEKLWSHYAVQGDDAPVVSDNRLYWASDSIYCFNLANHQLEWVVGGGDVLNSNPVVIGSKLYHGVTIGSAGVSVVRCLNTWNGSIVWSKAFSGFIASAFARWNDLLIVPVSNGSLYALDVQSGEIVWENSHTENGYWDTSPCIVGNTIYIGGQDSRCHAISVESGELLWETEPFPSGCEATPAYCDGIVVCGCRATIFAADAETGAILWQRDNGLHGSPTIADGLVYWGAYGSEFEKDSIYAADLYSGETEWAYLPDSIENSVFTTSPIVDGVMYTPVSNGNLYAFGTGLKYTYREDSFCAEVGSNQLIVTSWYNGTPVAADTISFAVEQTGINIDPPNHFQLSVSPNPLGTTSSISFALDEPGTVSLRVFDLEGREVTELLSQELYSGEHTVQWNGYENSGRQLSSGLYYCRIESGGIAETIGVCLLR